MQKMPCARKNHGDIPVSFSLLSKAAQISPRTTPSFLFTGILIENGPFAYTYII